MPLRVGWSGQQRLWQRRQPFDTAHLLLNNISQRGGALCSFGICGLELTPRATIASRRFVAPTKKGRTKSAPSF